MSRFDVWVRSVGQDPDPRFTLANERTFLSWVTTALGLLGLGLAVGTLIPGEHFSLSVLGGLWVLLAVVITLGAMLRWLRLERAMRLQRGLPLSRSIPLVALSLVLLSLATGLAAALAS